MAILSLLGLLLFFIGWIWLIVVGYKAGGILWAILIFLFSILSGLIFCIMKKEGWMQWAIMTLGWLLIIFGGGAAAWSAGMSGAGQ